MQAQDALLAELSTCDLWSLFNPGYDPRDIVLDHLRYDQLSCGIVSRARIIHGYLPYDAGMDTLIIRYLADINFIEVSDAGDITLTDAGMSFASRRFEYDPAASMHIVARDAPVWPAVDVVLETALKELVFVTRKDQKMQRYEFSDYGRSFRDRFLEIWPSFGPN